MLPLLKSCIHGFSKLSKSDVAYLLSLMDSRENWAKWEKIHKGIEDTFSVIRKQLEDCNRQAQTVDAFDTVNYSSIAFDMYVHTC